MAEVVIMPKLGFNMDEGQLVKWHKQVGETVKKGEVLFGINTDKTTMPVEATEDGTLLKIILEEGAFAEVFTPIAVTGAPGRIRMPPWLPPDRAGRWKRAPPLPSAPAAPVDMKSLKLTPKARKLVQDEGIDPASLTQIKGTGFQGGITYKDLKASPLARRVARQMGVDLAAVQGTGAAGKIMKADVEAAAAKAAPASAGSDTRQVASAVPLQGCAQDHRREAGPVQIHCAPPVLYRRGGHHRAGRLPQAAQRDQRGKDRRLRPADHGGLQGPEEIPRHQCHPEGTTRSSPTGPSTWALPWLVTTAWSSR